MAVVKTQAYWNRQRMADVRAEHVRQTQVAKSYGRAPPTAGDLKKSLAHVKGQLKSEAKARATFAARQPGAKKTAGPKAQARKAGGRAGAKAKLAAARGSMTRANNNLAKKAQAGTSRAPRKGSVAGKGRSSAKRAGGAVSAGGRTVGEIGAGRDFAGKSPPGRMIGGLTKAPAKGGKVGQAGSGSS